MDRSGFIVVHKDFVQSGRSEPPEVENVHITVKEAYIASRLIERGVLTKTACINFESIMDQYFWTVSFKFSQATLLLLDVLI